MTKCALVTALVVAALVACLPAFAETPIFSDDFENGYGEWTIYPGSPTCTAPRLVSTTDDAKCNHTQDGSYGLAMSSSAERVYHDVDLSTLPNCSVKFKLWFYDTMDFRRYGFDSFDIRSTTSDQVLGLGTYYSSRVYRYRTLRFANGETRTEWVNTPIARSLGWHLLEIDQYRGPEAGKVEFLIDGKLARRATGVYDTTLDRIVLGLGFSGLERQDGYVDDVSYSLVPEPDSTLALTGGLLGFVGLVRRRRA